MNSAEKIEAIKKVYEPGYSSAQIASLIPGAVRNGIISIYHRKADQLTSCPLPRGPSRGSRQPRPPRSPSARSPRIVRTSTIKAAISPRRPKSRPQAPKEVKPASEPIAKPEFRLIGLLDLGRDECKWPVEGFGEHARFCGCQAHAPGKPYCEFHRQMSVQS